MHQDDEEIRDDMKKLTKKREKEIRNKVESLRSVWTSGGDDTGLIIRELLQEIDRLRELYDAEYRVS